MIIMVFFLFNFENLHFFLIRLCKKWYFINFFISQRWKPWRRFSQGKQYKNKNL